MTRPANPFAALAALSALVLVGSAVAGWAESAAASTYSPARLVSATAAFGPGAGGSLNPDVSADGRYVAFASTATNFTGSGGGRQQIYRKDTRTGEIILISATAAGERGDANSYSPSISDDGDRVVFATSSSNFGAGFSQVFVRDVSEGSLTLVSRNQLTGAPANSNTNNPAISGDGAHIVFESTATDIVPGSAPRRTQIYQATLVDGAAPRLAFVSIQDSRRSSTPETASADATEAAVSRDGSKVVFTSAAVNLTGDTTDGVSRQVWVHDMNSGHTELLSRDVHGAGNNNSLEPDISGDGDAVVFRSASTFDGIANGGAFQVWARDLRDGGMALVSVDRLGVAVGNGYSGSPAISHDGKAVLFDSSATNLTSTSSEDAEARPIGQVYRRDLVTGVTSLISALPTSAADGADGGSGLPAISSDGRSIVFCSSSASLLGTGAPTSAVQVYMRDAPVNTVDRIGGADRYDVASGVAADSFGQHRARVYVASGETFADALSASAAAGIAGGPVLLVTKASIPASVSAQLSRLRPDAITIVGGRNSISLEVETALRALGGSVDRIGGADRYVVSAGVSRAAFGSGPIDTVYLASGAVFPDALAGAAATHGLGPVLLVTKDVVPDAVRAELTQLAPSKIIVLGGTAAVSEALLATLPTTAAVSRIGGADRYTVSANVSAQTFAAPVATAYVASGAVFPDALSGSAAAISTRAPVLLVTKDAVPAAVADELARLQPQRIIVLGGTAAISDAVRAQLATHLAPH